MLSIFKRKEDPPASEMLEWVELCEHTPDNWKLEQFIRQLVFCYCDLKAGGKNHGLIKDFINGPEPTEYRSTYTQNKFTLWKKDLGEHSFPIAMPEGYKPEGFTKWPVVDAYIQGELYFVPGYHIKELDNHKGNRLRFVRDRVKIRVPYRVVSWQDWTWGSGRKPLPNIQDGFYTVDAWMYTGVPSYWEDQIGGVFNSQMETYEHDTPRLWMDKFYKFNTG